MSNDTSALDGIYLHRLVKNVLPSDSGDEHVDAAYEELIGFAKSKLFLKFPAPELNQLLLQVRSRVTVHQFEQLQKTVEQLLRFKDPSDVARYLAFLTDSFDSQQRPAQPDNRQSVMNNFDRGSVYGDNKSVSNYATTVASFENDNFDRFSERKSVYSATYANDRNTLGELLIPYLESHVPDSEILNYISYTLVGTTSSVMPLKDGEVDIPVNISNGLSGMLHVVLEAGLTYQELTVAVEKHKTTKATSQTQVALVSFIASELDLYVQLVNNITINNQTTMKAILYTVYDSMVRLRFFCFILEGARDLPSYDLLSFVHAYTLHGDGLIQKSALSMFSYVLEPFLGSLLFWVINGEVKDKSDGFFIDMPTQSQETHREMVFASFYPERIPKFVTHEMAHQIYTIGLTNSFLKAGCRETEWANRFSQKAKLLLQEIKASHKFFLENSSFQKTIVVLHEEIMNFFTHTIYGKFRMDGIIRALCDYLLMAKGDFIECIISKGGSLLDEPSGALTAHQLTRLLQDAIVRTTPRYQMQSPAGKIILNNLDARLLAVGHGNIGWDVFTLDYRVDHPLDYLLNQTNNNHKREYLRVFNHLWKIKRLEHMFHDRWGDNRGSRQVKDKKSRRVMLIHNFIHGFLKTIEGFILHEIIDPSINSLFSKLENQAREDLIPVTTTGNDLKVSSTVLRPSAKFLKKINSVNSTFERVEHGFNELPIEEIQNIHEKFLKSITQHSLLNGSTSSGKHNVSGKTYIGQMNSLIDISYKFVLSEKEFNQLQLTLATITEDTHAHNVRRRLQTIYDNLLILFNEFNSRLRTFVGDLSHDDDVQLRYLGVSLNQ